MRPFGSRTSALVRGVSQLAGAEHVGQSHFIWDNEIIHHSNPCQPKLSARRVPEACESPGEWSRSTWTQLPYFIMCRCRRLMVNGLGVQRHRSILDQRRHIVDARGPKTKRAAGLSGAVLSTPTSPREVLVSHAKPAGLPMEDAAPSNGLVAGRPRAHIAERLAASWQTISRWFRSFPSERAAGLPVCSDGADQHPPARVPNVNEKAIRDSDDYFARVTCRLRPHRGSGADSDPAHQWHRVPPHECGRPTGLRSVPPGHRYRSEHARPDDPRPSERMKTPGHSPIRGDWRLTPAHQAIQDRADSAAGAPD